MSTDLDQNILDISASIENLKKRMETMDPSTRARAERTCGNLRARILELHEQTAPRRSRRIRSGCS